MFITKNYSLKNIFGISASTFLCVTGIMGITIKSIAGDGPSKSGRLFKGFGISVLSQFEESPVALTPYYTTSYNNVFGTRMVEQTGNNAVRYGTFSIESCAYIVRYNLIEMGSNASISIAAAPSVAFSFGILTVNGAADQNANEDTPGLLSVNIPAFIEFNYGNVSTFSADKDMGFVFGAGYEFTKSPLIIPTPPTGVGNDGSTYVPLNTTTLWFEPVVELGIRFWNSNSHARELNLKYGFGTPLTYEDNTGANKTANSWTIRLSYIFYTNY